jgi:hypothetical protein
MGRDIGKGPSDRKMADQEKRVVSIDLEVGLGNRRADRQNKKIKIRQQIPSFCFHLAKPCRTLSPSPEQVYISGCQDISSALGVNLRSGVM